MLRPGTLLALTVCLFGCVSTQPRDQDLTATPDTITVEDLTVWRFDFVDTDQESLGYLLMVFTNDTVDEPTCGNDYWKNMVVLENSLDFDFGVESRPAYTLNGPWLTIDLTASVCYLDHNLIGDMTADGASGFFTFSHKLGGYNIGRFTARPVSRARSAESVDWPG